MKDSERRQLAEAAIALHKAWMKLVNFHHLGMFSSRMAEALEARKAERAVQDAYDEAFAQLTAVCELHRQTRLTPNSQRQGLSR